MGRIMKKILLALLLASCGFRPMYTGTDMDIYVAPINGIDGIELRNALNAQFGGTHDESAKYKIVVNLGEPVTKYKAFEKTGDAAWQEIVLTADYTITSGDKSVAKGRETASESYSYVSYLVASNASYNNAVKNTISVLAQKIGTRAIAETQSFEDK